MVSTNYSGRSVDLFVFQGASPSRDQQITLSFGVAGQLTTGIQKMAQTFTNLFLTERGSVKFYPEAGTDFLLEVQQGALRDEYTVKSAFALAASTVKSAMLRTAELANPPLDEIISTVTLQSFSLDKAAGKLTLYVKLVSKAAPDSVIYLPISVPLR